MIKCSTTLQAAATLTAGHRPQACASARPACPVRAASTGRATKHYRCAGSMPMAAWCGTVTAASGRAARCGRALPPSPRPPRRPADYQTDYLVLAPWARDLGEACAPVAGEARAYLDARRCVIPPRDGDLRWHPSLQHPSGHVGPALTRAPMSLHRTWVRPDGKADVDRPRRVLARHHTRVSSDTEENPMPSDSASSPAVSAPAVSALAVSDRRRGRLTAEQVAARDRKRVRRPGRPRLTPETVVARRSELPVAYEQFDRLPDTGYVNQRVVELLFDISSSTVWRRVRTGALPAPEKFGLKTTRWNVGKLRRVRAA